MLIKGYCLKKLFRSKLLFILTIIFFAVSLFLFSFASRNNEQFDKRKKLPFEANTLRINLGCEPPSLDWIKATDAASFDVISNIMVGLTAYNQQLECSPACAQSWEILEKGKLYVFHLRSNILWSDGKPLTAYDFEYAWRRLLNPQTAAPYAFFLYDIKNAFAYNQGKLKNIEELGIKATDKNTLTVRLSRPVAYFLYLTAFCPTFPQRQDIIEKFANKWTEPDNLICNGPFLLKKWQHEYKIELAANPLYFAGTPSLKKIKMFMIPENSTAFALYENSQLDFIDNRSFPTAEIEHHRLSDKTEFKNCPLLRVSYLGFNVQKKPFDKVKIRQAFSLAIDREHVCRILHHGEKPIANLIPPPLLASLPFSSGSSYNPALARKLLTEAGYPNGKNFPDVFLLYPHREDTRLLVEAIQDELKRNLNIEVNLSNQEWQVYLQTLHNNTPPIYRYAWGADYPDPDTFMNLFTSHNGNNNTHWSSKSYDNLVNSAGCESNKEKRSQLYKKADYLLCKQEAPIIPINTASQNMLIKPWVHGVNPNPLDLQFFHNVYIGN